MYNLLEELRRRTPLYIISVIDSGDWVWIRIGLPRLPASTTLRFRKTNALKPYNLLLDVEGEEVPVQGASAEEQAEQVWALLQSAAGS